MCISTPSVMQSSPIPTATPTAQTTSTGEGGQAVLDQYAEGLKRRGIGSTVKTSGSGLAATATGAVSGNQGLTSSGSSQTLG